MICLAYSTEYWRVTDGQTERRTLNAVNVRKIDVLWNISFRHVLNCCWQESVKQLQFYCHSLPLSYQLHERQLLFIDDYYTQ